MLNNKTKEEYKSPNEKGHKGFREGHSGYVGTKNYGWKGKKIEYATLHQWVRRWKGKPNKCDSCGTTKAKKFEWANVDHKYRRVLEDYLRMCTTCHRAYDRDVLKLKVGRTKNENK